MIGRFLLLLTCVATLIGCSDSSSEKRAKIALNWKAEPEFGGIYEAQRLGLFTHHGVDVEITGGANAPVIQMVASGQVEFGIASADEVVLARDRGSDIVALFATYQTSPQGIMVHKSRGFTKIDDLFASGTLAVEPGLPYVKFLESKYGFEKIKVVPYNYSIAPFLEDKNFAQQCFVTSEPIAARGKDTDPQVFLIADLGFNPYTAVVITRGEVVAKKPRMVRAVLKALREGWTSYIAGPDGANIVMANLNTAMDAQTFKLVADAQKPLIEGNPPQKTLGLMTTERWATLIGQLSDIKLIDHPMKPEDCFVDPARFEKP